MTPSDSSSSSLLSPASDRDSLFHDLVTYRLASSSPPPNSHLFPSTPSASFRLLRRLDPSSHDDITPRPPLPPKSPVAHGQQYFYSRARQIRQPIEQQDELKSNPDSNCSEEPFPCNMIESNKKRDRQNYVESSLPSVNLAERNTLRKMSDRLQESIGAISALCNERYRSQGLRGIIEMCLNEQNLYDDVFKALIDKEYTICRERGHVLHQIRALYQEMFTAIPIYIKKLYDDIGSVHRVRNEVHDQIQTIRNLEDHISIIEHKNAEMATEKLSWQTDKQKLENDYKMLRNNFQNLKDNNEAVQHPDHHPTITPVEFNDGNGFSEPLESLVNRESNTENGHGTEEAQRQAENVHDMEEAQRQVVQASQDGIVPEVKPNRENEPIYDDVREQPLSHGLFANQDQNVESQLRESDLGVNQSKCLKDSSVQHSSRDHHQAISSILVRVDGLLDNMTDDEESTHLLDEAANSTKVLSSLNYNKIADYTVDLLNPDQNQVDACVSTVKDSEDRGVEAIAISQHVNEESNHYNYDDCDITASITATAIACNENSVIGNEMIAGDVQDHTVTTSSDNDHGTTDEWGNITSTSVSNSDWGTCNAAPVTDWSIEISNSVNEDVDQRNQNYDHFVPVIVNHGGDHMAIHDGDQNLCFGSKGEETSRQDTGTNLVVKQRNQHYIDHPQEERVNFTNADQDTGRSELPAQQPSPIINHNPNDVSVENSRLNSYRNRSANPGRLLAHARLTSDVAPGEITRSASGNPQHQIFGGIRPLLIPDLNPERPREIPYITSHRSKTAPLFDGPGIQNTSCLSQSRKKLTPYSSHLSPNMSPSSQDTSSRNLYVYPGSYHRSVDRLHHDTFLSEKAVIRFINRSLGAVYHESISRKSKDKGRGSRSGVSLHQVNMKKVLISMLRAHHGLGCMVYGKIKEFYRSLDLYRPSNSYIRLYRSLLEECHPSNRRGHHNLLDLISRIRQLIDSDHVGVSIILNQSMYICYDKATSIIERLFGTVIGEPGPVSSFSEPKFPTSLSGSTSTLSNSIKELVSKKARTWIDIVQDVGPDVACKCQIVSPRTRINLVDLLNPHDRRFSCHPNAIEVIYLIPIIAQAIEEADDLYDRDQLVKLQFSRADTNHDNFIGFEQFYEIMNENTIPRFTKYQLELMFKEAIREGGTDQMSMDRYRVLCHNLVGLRFNNI